MKRNLLISIVAILIGGFFVSSVVADDKRQHDTLVKFQGGIGVHPVSNVTFPVAGPPSCGHSVSQNIVRGVNPPARSG